MVFITACSSSEREFEKSKPSSIEEIAKAKFKSDYVIENNENNDFALCTHYQKTKIPGPRTLNYFVYDFTKAEISYESSIVNGKIQWKSDYKLMIEEILQDLNVSDDEWNVALLRYFNPVGAHKSGRIGEDPNGIPNNLMPYVSQVAVGKLERVTVFGDDYPTHDGTGVRDYIHVVDLALGHVRAIEKLMEKPGVVIYNLGTGQGYSVLDMIKAFSEASGREVPYVISGRRAGDIAACYADPAKAKRELNWVAERGVKEMCEDTWRWQTANPKGY